MMAMTTAVISADVDAVVRSKPDLDGIVTQCMTDLGLDADQRPPVVVAILDAYSRGLNDALMPIRELLLSSQG